MYQIRSLADYQRHYQEALKNPAGYWEGFAKEFKWQSPWKTVLSGNFSDVNVRWFDGGQVNITENCIDRHLPHFADKTALIFESNDPDHECRSYTYQELYEEVCQTAHLLKKLGIKKGDRVVFYMSQVPQLAFGILACARIGAVHSVVFAGFSASSLAGRIADCKAKVIVTNNEGLRGNKTIGLKGIVDEALKLCPTVEKCLVFKRTETPVNMEKNRDVWWHDLVPGLAKDCPPEKLNSEDPLFILYTSGSTGKPKGLLHTTAGYMIYVAYSFKNVFQVDGSKNSSDVFWCTADIGWITGHSYLTYGPLLNGATTLMFEGIPTWPDAGRFWQIIDKYNVSHFYTAPTAIRSLMGQDLALVKRAKLHSLKVLGTVGEPINEEAWQWYHQHIGQEKCPIVDTWWQTETGGILISPLANITKTKPCYATLPLPGIVPVLVDEHGQVISDQNVSGNLCLQTPWPSIARTIYGDHERYRQTYFSTYPGRYFTGDGCRRDEDGYYRITGRVDDVLNVSGHRLGTAEIENALNQHEEVIESAVVGYPHDIKGEGIYAYVICQQPPKNIAQFRQDLLNVVVKEIGAIAKPDKIQIVPGLPKTRSGKIMRRILRKIAAQDFSNFGDISTLLDPEVVKQIQAGAL